ncbi:hypothetical protein HJC23_013713 [Cyclotella cryptica]|uniref:Uncharacterized protein n=1 Tax=Cyclotella cryptica TaxID=29204 RepID=A0ABD3QW91_9STRA|eukprot:CCRYP_001580-RA/>CCRYP_001580-RA protein AED:0.06 eAED:0.05 QI:0/0.25/0.2/0.8/1/1/5/0/1838
MMTFDEFKRAKRATATNHNQRLGATNSSYAHQNVSRTSLHSRASPDRPSCHYESEGSVYSRTNVSRISIRGGDDSTGSRGVVARSGGGISLASISRSDSILSYDEFQQLRRESEALRREFELLRRQHAASATAVAANANGHTDNNDGIRVSSSTEEGVRVSSSTIVASDAKRKPKHRGGSVISSKQEFGHSTSTRVVCNRENVDCNQRDSRDSMKKGPGIAKVAKLTGRGAYRASLCYNVLVSEVRVSFVESIVLLSTVEMAKTTATIGKAMNKSAKEVRRLSKSSNSNNDARAVHQVASTGHGGHDERSEQEQEAMRQSQCRAKQIDALNAVTDAFSNVDACKAFAKLSTGAESKSAKDEARDPSVTSKENLHATATDTKGLFPDLLGKNKYVFTNDIPASMSILTEDTSHKRNTMDQDQKLEKHVTKSVKKAAKSISHTSSAIATTVVHTTNIVAPKLATAATNATKVVTANVVEATKAAQKISKEVAQVTHESMDAAITVMDQKLADAKTPAKSNRTNENTGLLPDGRYSDYVHDPDYKVNLTPPVKTPIKSNNYDYLSDPATPYCLRGAMAAGICALSDNHPNHPEYIPEGIPRVIDVSDDWEEKAGFVSSAAIERGSIAGMGRESTAQFSAARTTFDTNQVLPFSAAECDGKPIDMDATVQGSLVENQDEGEGPPELESVDDEDCDPRNHSMWVAVPADEDLEEEDTIMNLGDIIVDVYDEEYDGKDLEFCPPEDILSPASCGTYHIGDVRMGFSFGAAPDIEASLTNEQRMNEVLVETVDSEDEEGPYLDEDCDESVKDDNDHLKMPMEEDSSNNFDSEKPVENLEAPTRMKNLPFETPFSVQKGERPLTFTEFRHMNKRVLFDEDKSVNEEEQMKQPNHVMEEESRSLATTNSPTQVSRNDENTPRYSTDWLYEQDVASNKAETGKRQLKGRVLLLRIGKKISKVKSKGKNVLRQVFVLPLRGTKSKETALTNGGLSGENADLILADSHPAPTSPSSESVASIASSLITTGSCTNRIIGAAPVYHDNIKPPLGLPYGAINYTRSVTDSTMDDSLPPPPMNFPGPDRNPSDNPEEDAVSYIAAAMNSQTYSDEYSLGAHNDSKEDAAIACEDDIVSIMATINAEELDDYEGDESSVFLVVTPKEGQEGSYQVISGFDGTTPVNVKDIIHHLGEDEDAIISDIKPNNLTGLFTDKSRNDQDASFSIIEAEEGFVLTPTTVNHNVSNVFRQSTGTPIVEPVANTGTLPNLLPGSMVESEDEDEDETLLYHDGCTVIRQTSTFGDNTIATSATAVPHIEEVVGEPKDTKKLPTNTPVAKAGACNPSGIDTPNLSPDQPSFSKQAAKNGSFLFSDGNMGRAAPRIREKERAALKQGHGASSLTMLPSSKAISMDSKAVTAIMSRLSYSSNVTDPPLPSSTTQGSMSPLPMIAMEPTVELKKSFDDSIKVEIQKKPVMSSMTDARQFSFKSTLNKFSADSTEVSHYVSSPSTSDQVITVDKQDVFATPLVTNCGEKKKKYPTTPFPEDVVTGNGVNLSLSSEPQCTASPAGSTISKSSRKKPSPKQKPIPKSALKTRQGLVKDRITDIQQRMEVTSAVTGVNGRLKKNHSYKLKNPRRMTNGDRALAPRKAVLQNPIFVVRSVPIAIAKSYSKDETENAPMFLPGSRSFESGGTTKNFHGTMSDKESATAYASKYTSVNEKSPNSSSSPCSESGSSYVSESTECDPFNSLLGKLSVDDDELSDDSHTENKVFFDDSGKGKENTNNVDCLPFKSEALVKPTEINQHDKRVGFTSPRLQHSPLSRSPMQARTWRTLAAAAAEKKSSSRSVAGKGALRHD